MVNSIESAQLLWGVLGITVFTSPLWSQMIKRSDRDRENKKNELEEIKERVSKLDIEMENLKVELSKKVSSEDMSKILVELGEIRTTLNIYKDIWMEDKKIK